MANFIGEDQRTTLQVWFPIILAAVAAIAFICWVWKLKVA